MVYSGHVSIYSLLPLWKAGYNINHKWSFTSNTKYAKVAVCVTASGHQLPLTGIFRGVYGGCIKHDIYHSIQLALCMQCTKRNGMMITSEDTVISSYVSITKIMLFKPIDFWQVELSMTNQIFKRVMSYLVKYSL